MSLPKYIPVRSTVTEQPLVDSKEMVIDSPSTASHHHEHGHARCRCTHDDELMYSNSNHEHGGNGHRRCHNARLRRYLLPALAVLLLLCGLMAVSCMQGYGSLEEWGSGAGEGLFSRQVGPGASNGSGSTFTNRKLYLIVIFVGLFLVLVFGVMLAAWCCRGSFENPLCCPCYLCACCGGLACLDCIACGLCAEAVETM